MRSQATKALAKLDSVFLSVPSHDDQDDHLNNIPEISQIICYGGFALFGAPVPVHQELVVMRTFLHLVVGMVMVVVVVVVVMVKYRKKQMSGGRYWYWIKILTNL